jgi:hypothetical protein
MNPLQTLARNQTVGETDANIIQLSILLHIDTIKREACTDVGRDWIARNILTAALIGKSAKSKRLEGLAIVAYNALCDAVARSSELLRFTTGEYKAVMALFRAYLPMLSSIKLGIMSDSSRNAAAIYEGERGRICA